MFYYICYNEYGENMIVIVEKCPSCGAPLEYDSEHQKWICKYCQKEYEIEDLSDKEIRREETRCYHCPNCGADIICNQDNITSNCLYCDSPVIIEDRIIGDFKPDYIIPFIHTEEEVKNAFKSSNSTKDNPSEKYFRKENIISIKGMYVPYWLVSSEVSVAIEGDWHKSKHSLSHFRRKGTVSFKRIPVVAKTTLSPKEFQFLEPFDYTKLKPFHYAYLSGLYAEKYNSSKDDVYEKEIKERLEKVSLTALCLEGTAYPEKDISTKKINIFWTKFEYAFVPIWIIKVKYNGKVYTNYLNDQNFYIGGEIPVSTSKKSHEIIQSFLILAIVLLFLFQQQMSAIIALALFFVNTISFKTGKKKKRKQNYISGAVIITENSEISY